MSIIGGGRSGCTKAVGEPVDRRRRGSSRERMEFPTVDHRRSARTVKSDPTTGTRLEALSMLATCFTSGGRTACNGKLASESVGYASKKPIPTSV